MECSSSPIAAQSHLLFKCSVVNRYKSSRPTASTNQPRREQCWLKREEVELGAGTCKEQRPSLCPLSCEADGMQKSHYVCPKPALMVTFVAVSYSPLQQFVVLWKLKKVLWFQCCRLFPSGVSKIRGKFSSQLYSKKGNCLCKAALCFCCFLINTTKYIVNIFFQFLLYK